MVYYQKGCSMEEIMSNIPKLIAEKEIRDNKRYKQIDIANETNLSQSMISRLIKGNVKLENVTLGVAIPLAEWLECSVEDLYIVKGKS